MLGYLVAWLFGCLVCLLGYLVAGYFVAWLLVCLLLGCLLGYLVAWLLGCMVTFLVTWFFELLSYLVTELLSYMVACY